MMARLVCPSAKRNHHAHMTYWLNCAGDGNKSYRGRPFIKGQWIDCEDITKRVPWARIVDVRGDAIFVHYDGWQSKWDEWIDLRKQFWRVALYGSWVPDPDQLSRGSGSGPVAGDHLGAGRVLPAAAVPQGS